MRSQVQIGLKIMVTSICVGCASNVSSNANGVPLTQAEKEALNQLEKEDQLQAQRKRSQSKPRASSQTPVKNQNSRQLIKIPNTSNENSDERLPSTIQCLEFRFFSQRQERLNAEPFIICQGDSDRKVLLRSRQGRTATLNVSADALIDPVAGVSFVSENKLLCFDHRRPPSAMGTWFKGMVVVNCCSGVSFQRLEQGNGSRVVSGRIDGPPANCGQE